MRIGLVIYGSLDTLSGGYLYDRRLVEYLRAQGDAVEILSLPWRNYATHLTHNLHFRLPPHLDILIQDELNHPSLLAANGAKHPYPVISLVHHLRSSELRPAWQNAFYRFFERKYLQGVDGFIFNSKTTERVVDELIGRASPRVVAHPPTDRFSDPIPEQEIVMRAGHHPLRILFLGNVIHRKGLHLLLEAIRPMPVGLCVEVVGSLNVEPRYAEKMEEYVRANHLDSMVTFHGPLDSEPLAAQLRQAHLLAVPSSYEGFGIVYLEGMCFGLPAIGSTAGAAGEIINEGVNGWLVEPGDVDSLGSHLTRLNKDREMLSRMGLAARQRYIIQPKWTETAGRIREFLLERVKAFPA